MKWQIRYCINAFIGVLPISIQLNLRSLKRKFIPNQVRVGELQISQGLRQIHMLKKAGINPLNKNCLEIGTGWSPVIPILFVLAGCKSITLLDSQRLMDENSFKQTIGELQKHIKLIAVSLSQTAQSIEEKLNSYLGLGLDLNRMLSEMNLLYKAPYNLAEQGLENDAYDIIFSRAVFEHIPPENLNLIIKRLYDLLKPNGAMCHIIDNSDHWEHKDKSINRVNFLRFSNSIFKLISMMNPLDFQNRLRHSEYIKLFKKTGFKIHKDDSEPDQKTLSVLHGAFKIHSDFKGFENKDLAVLTSFILAKKN